MKLHTFDELVRRVGVSYELQHHSRLTRTCAEKASIAGIQESEILKTLYVGRRGDYIGISLPANIGTVDYSGLLRETMGLSRKRSKSYRFGDVPDGMQPGTCGPIVTQTARESIVGMILIHPADDRYMDVSVGGTDEESLAISVRMRYSDISTLVRSQFGDRMKLVSLKAFKHCKTA